MKEIRIRKKQLRKGECSYFPEGDYEKREVEVSDEYDKEISSGKQDLWIHRNPAWNIGKRRK